MNEKNAAQRLMESIGAPIDSSVKQAHGNENASTSKRGPGRFHRPGHQKASPHASKGAPAGFVLHTSSADKQQRKALIAKIGRRQYLRQIKQYRRDLADYAAQHRPEWADA